MEALIALAVVVMVMTALVTALVSAISSTTYSNEQTTATAYAQEGLDFARAFKNRDFSAFNDLANTEHRLGANPSTIPTSNASIDGKFYRYLYVNKNGIDGRTSGGTKCVQDNGPSIFVASIVEWSDSKCSAGTRCREVVLSSCFANLNYIEGP